MLAKKMFHGRYEIRYDTLIDHDAYNFLRISIEVPRDQSDECLVVLNGKEVGLIVVANKINGKAKTFHAYRYIQKAKNKIAKQKVKGEFDNVGRATASIISDFVKS